MSEPTTQHVAVAVITDPHDRILVVWHEAWGSFTLPLTKLRPRPHGAESADDAALRAGADALGVPVRPADALPDDTREWLLSGRTGVSKNYHFHLRRVDAHPAFADRLNVRVPHFWASPYSLLDATEFQPLSPTVPPLVARCLGAFDLPQRTVYTTTLVLTRTALAGHTEFLLRWNPHWERWAFPAGPRESDDARPPAERVAAVAAEDLGPDAAFLKWSVHADEVTLDGMASGGKKAKGVPTRYHHEVATAGWGGGVFRSTEPLHWATADELIQHRTGGVPQLTGAPAGRSGPVSPTAARIADALGVLDHGRGYDDDIRGVIADW